MKSTAAAFAHIMVLVILGQSVCCNLIPSKSNSCQSAVSGEPAENDTDDNEEDNEKIFEVGVTLTSHLDSENCGITLIPQRWISVTAEVHFPPPKA